MARFQGTVEEFHRYFGPRARNVVNNITKGYRKDLGKCENCQSPEKLEAAHIRGKERPAIISEVLKETSSGDGVNVDLIEFENRFKDFHYPLDSVIKILCAKCHREYDAKVANLATPEYEIKKTPAEQQEAKVLPIALRPQNVQDFKTQLLQTRQAKITINYQDNTVRQIDWNAHNLTETSSIMGNLRSRVEFRQGNWQQNNIREVLVEVIDNK